MVLSAFHLEISEHELAQLAGTNEFGTELTGLVETARSLGFECEALTIDFAELQRCSYPIVYLDGLTLDRAFLMHAVVVEEIAIDVKVLDPTVGETTLPRALFSSAWEQAGSFAVVIRPRKKV